MLDVCVALAQKHSKRSLTVLMYHRVITKPDPFFDGILLQQFDQQMRYIAEHWHPVSEQQVLDFYYDSKPLPEGAVFVTFDDGTEDTYSLALPVLEKYGIPGIVFVCQEACQFDGLLWTDELALLLKHSNLSVLDIAIGGEQYRFSLANEADKVEALWAIKSILKQLDNAERLGCLSEISRQLGELSADQRTGYMLTAEQMQRLQQGRVSVAAHTRSHPIMSQIDADVARYEVESSRDYLSDLGFVQQSFCYPNGRSQDFTQETKTIVRNAGYKLAYSTIEGVNNENTDPFELRRLHVSGLSLPAFKSCLLRSLIKRGLK